MTGVNIMLGTIYTALGTSGGDAQYKRMVIMDRQPPEGAMMVCRMVLGNIPASCLYATLSALCACAVRSEFAADIAELDPCNTYGCTSEAVARDLSALAPGTMEASALPFLDADIAARMESGNPLDICGAIALQILREYWK